MRSNTIDLYYFSGTGNTRLVVNEMTEFFIKQGYDIQLGKIEKSDPTQISLEHTIGLAFPVAMQSTYKFIWEFFEEMPKTTSNTEVFMVDTLAGFSGGIVGPLGKLLNKKGYRTISAKEIIMPSNFSYSAKKDEQNKVKIENGLTEAKRYAFNLIFNRGHWPKNVLPNPLENISRLDKALDYMHKLVGFEVDESKCVKCGLCASLCPVENIILNPFPNFSDNCVICLRCISYCPQQAITTKRKNYKIYRAIQNSNEL